MWTQSRNAYRAGRVIGYGKRGSRGFVTEHLDRAVDLHAGSRACRVTLLDRRRRTLVSTLHRLRACLASSCSHCADSDAAPSADVRTEPAAKLRGELGFVAQRATRVGLEETDEPPERTEMRRREDRAGASHGMEVAQIRVSALHLPGDRWQRELLESGERRVLRDRFENGIGEGCGAQTQRAEVRRTFEERADVVGATLEVREVERSQCREARLPDLRRLPRRRLLQGQGRAVGAVDAGPRDHRSRVSEGRAEVV
jgi:hypothetical protein